jgi:hypothetical protein
MKLPEILARLETASKELRPMRGQLERDCPGDTAMTLGEALGVIHRAKTLVERDLKLQQGQTLIDRLDA